MVLSVACGSSSSSSSNTLPDVPFVLLMPDSDQTVARGEPVVFTGTMDKPEDYEYIEVMWDADQIWANGNEDSAAFGLPAAEVTIEWDTVAMDPGTYFIVIVVQKEGARAYGYPPITVTITGDEMFTLTQPTANASLQLGEVFTIEGVLRSVDRFETVEFYLDGDASWGNSNETLIMDLAAVDNLSGNWTIQDTPTGTYYIAIVLYFTGGGGRLIGYLDPTLTVEPMILPD
jgi:hypothetical protein